VERLDAQLDAIRALATERPLVLWLDDVHWTTEALRLARRLLDTPAPVLVVCTVRTDDLLDLPAASERLDQLARHPKTLSLHLGPLEPQDCGDLVRGLLGLEGETASRVEARCQGVPLFAVQLVGDWVQRGILVATSEGFRPRQGAELHLPDALQDLWAGRVEDALRGQPAGAEAALELAAVLGVQVDDEVWAEAAREHEPVAPGLVEALLVRNLMVHDPDGGLRFVHGMLVESLLTRAESHNRLPAHRSIAARALNRLAGCMPPARHARRVELASRAMTIAADGSADHRRAATNLGSALRTRGRASEALPILAAAADGVEALGDDALTATALQSYGSALSAARRFDEAIVQLERCVALMRDTDADPTRALISLGGAYSENHEFAAGARCLDEAIAAARSPLDRGIALHHRGVGQRNQRESDAGAALIQHAIDTIELEMSPEAEAWRARFYSNLASAEVSRKNYEAGLDASQRAAEVFSRIGHHRSEAVARLNAAQSLARLKRLDPALNEIRAGLDLARATGVPRLMLFALCIESEIHLERGDLESASRAVEEMNTIGGGPALGEAWVEALSTRARLQAARGAHAEARQTLLDAIDFMDSEGMPEDHRLRQRVDTELRDGTPTP